MRSEHQGSVLTISDQDLDMVDRVVLKTLLTTEQPCPALSASLEPGLGSLGSRLFK